ncbi:hypothetical protein C8R43DRAFT_1135604 [Mycena crocata]|nr:hypothetical protein C8R43DRAFT_1135604 [Mycena crocata]
MAKDYKPVYLARGTGSQSANVNSARRGVLRVNHLAAAYRKMTSIPTRVAGTASIAIVRFRAIKFPKKGTLFLNTAAVPHLATQRFVNLIGHDWDLLDLDPRGVKQTSPQMQCFESAADYNIVRC